MQNPLLSTVAAASMSSVELRAFAALAPRQLSLFCTRYAAAKDSITGSAEQAAFLAAAKESYKRSCEDEHGQVMRVRSVSAVVESRGAKLDAEKGKDVGKLAMGRLGAIWKDSWIAR